MNKTILRDSLLVTFIVSIVVLMGCMFGDGVSAPIQAALGSNSQEIHDSQNMTLLSDKIEFVILAIIGIFALSIVMLKYLKHGE